ncbi:ras GTPase-activating protein nGAP-like isoform X3 [Liolophura sinensis]|uniref:ras GTPase-activating protein nGAP-like isoform X3 n=1 Tax=Liolophura sinensis TaxID=3198878 RepID=UPI0031597159
MASKACDCEPFSGIDALPGRVEGWLNVWELDRDDDRLAFADGVQPLPLWNPRFCVLLHDGSTFTCHPSEDVANMSDLSCSGDLETLRLDCGKEEFDKRWGYETLQSIKENAIQHSPEDFACVQEEDTISTESFFKSRTLDSRKDSYSDLSENRHYEPEHGSLRIRKHSSYDKAVTERRGSVPLVPSSLSNTEVTMDTGTTSTNRIANFFSKKTFRTNLKRTKSVTKLDRKRSIPASSENDPPCQCVVQTPEALHTWSIISSRIRTSRSHESLLSSPSSMHSIDLTAPDIEIKPLHSSILGQDHCFQVSTSNGSKYISCRTAEEREKWIESLRKTVHPNQEQSRRTDNSLKLWVIEAKNVPSKKRYFCEICLDRTLYARTSSKTKSEMCFWGEQFEFNNLPAVETITVNLYREADRKKKKDRNQLLGYINLPVNEITNRQYVEKWFVTSSGTVGKAGKESKTELPLIRVKAKYQSVQILPMDLYKDLINYLTSEYCLLCEVLEPILSVRDKEDIAKSLVHIMQKMGRAKDFLADVVMGEIARLDNEHLTFRGNSIATKAMEAFMKLVGEKYLQDTLGEFVKNVIDTPDDCEVDPGKVQNNTILQRHQTNLIMYCEMAWVKIINSYCYFPSELKDVFSSFRERCQERKKEDISDNLISASIFLRFLCPAILSPSLFSLTQEYPQEKAARNLTLIAKTIQTLANFTKFGGKEEFMVFMNEFVEREWGSMKNFLGQISSSDSNHQLLEFDGYIDLGKELSILHSLLKECLSKTSETVVQKLGKLNEIVEKLTEALNDPNAGKKSNRQSQIYDNLNIMNLQNNNNNGEKTTSPTEVLRDMLRGCGEDVDLLNVSVGSESLDTLGRPRYKGSTPIVYTDGYEYVLHQRTDGSSVADVSSVANTLTNQQTVDKSWTEIVSAAEEVNGDYNDLISFMEDGTEDQNSSMELERDMRGSQMSISQLSTIASSGYQSFGYSQSSSPVENHAHGDAGRDTSKSPSVAMQPLSFSNPVYRHQLLNSHRRVTNMSTSSTSSPPPIQRASSSSSLNSDDESNSIKQRSPAKSQDWTTKRTDPLKKFAGISSSSSSESLTQDDKAYVRSYSTPRPTDPRRKPLSMYSSNTFQAHSSPKQGHRGTRPPFPETPIQAKDLSQSADFVYMQRRHATDQLRRAATDTVISQNLNSPSAILHRRSEGSSRSLGCSHSPPESPSCAGVKRLSQGGVLMGVSSVQRRLHEQEKTKQEYEFEVVVLRQQLAEAQRRLQQAEARLADHEYGAEDILHEWRHKLEESEERMRRQQAEKDDHMKNIIHRLIGVEEDLRQEQTAMQRMVTHKQKVIEDQERKIQTLDTANSRLLVTLNQLKDHCSPLLPHNGLVASNNGQKITLIKGADTSCKSSAC